LKKFGDETSKHYTRRTGTKFAWFLKNESKLYDDFFSWRRPYRYWNQAYVSLKNGTKILLDCGLFQGLGAETEALNHHFGFNPAEVSVLLLSHAHIDHSGLIPKLVREGFTGKIWCTEATRDLTEILLYDSAEIQTYETEAINKKRAGLNQPLYAPLYTTEDVTEALKRFEVIEYNNQVEISNGVTVCFTNSGHLVGSAAIHLKITGRRKRHAHHLQRRCGPAAQRAAAGARTFRASRLPDPGKHLWR
jgi:glyoxylase-like metal-dependent hydrolase (beta-lactamase superfamily II)